MTNPLQRGECLMPHRKLFANSRPALSYSSVIARNGKRGRRCMLAAAVFILVMAGAGVGVRAALKTDPRIDSSRLAAVERGDIARSVVATGKIQPRSKVEVKS